ncbi:MAG: glutathione S-transferase family protein [Gammaproteobacteria bacterium]
MLTLYDSLDSGNAYKVRLALAHLAIPCHRIELDTDSGETRTAEYLAKNPNGKVPALELDDGEVLWESDAIMYYLADGTALLPQERLARARVLQWMFFEQYSHEPYIATTRYFLYFLKDAETYAEQIARNTPRGYAALDVMETRLGEHEYLVGESYSLADIALYAYTHVADEGGFDLASYSGIRSWLDRVRDQPLHIPMERMPG